ncbi:MAG: glucose-1-phosphate thymidylyltransferase RfbA [Caulobacteraceae bacterium]|nr:glucose-1-phosphate thymidylyltransferase RfbA [Caulobacter sp.]
MKGIILAAGDAPGLRPATRTVPKALLPIYDKPMVYHPLSTLMLAGVRDLLVITTPRARPQFEACLGDGAQFGVSLTYAEQAEPRGIADAFLIGEAFLAGGPAALILGDTLFFGAGLTANLRDAAALTSGARIFAARVRNPERYGVVGFDAEGRPVALEEKPQHRGSDWAVTGLYVYGPDVVEVARGVRPSLRGQLEITDVNRAYLERGELDVRRLPRGETWLDTRRHDSLAEAAAFIRALEHRQGLKIACPEEIALHAGWLTPAETAERGRAMGKTDYGRYLLELAGAAGAAVRAA